MKRLDWIAAGLSVLLLLGGYVGAYFACSQYEVYGVAPGRPRPMHIRKFPSEAVGWIFTPMIRLESMIRSVDVMASPALQDDVE